MILIQEFRDSPINTSITKAKYVEGSDNFDEWHALVREKYPNVTDIDCSSNKLTKINCYSNIRKLDCSLNNLKILNYAN
jgi:hypothetical protein